MENLKKIACRLLVMLMVCAAGSCNFDALLSSATRSPISVEAELDKIAYCINENIIVQVLLKNTGEDDLLIDGGWSLLPVSMPPEISSGALVLLDSTGEHITVTVHIDRIPVHEDSFVILAPGEVISKSVTLHDRLYGDSDNYFSYSLKESETYTVMAIYQNVLQFSRTVNGEQVAAWTGEASTRKMFQIKSKDCLNQ